MIIVFSVCSFLRTVWPQCEESGCVWNEVGELATWQILAGGTTDENGADPDFITCLLCASALEYQLCENRSPYAQSGIAQCSINTHWMTDGMSDLGHDRIPRAVSMFER